jgi:hypothetical protein
MAETVKLNGFEIHGEGIPIVYNTPLAVSGRSNEADGCRKTKASRLQSAALGPSDHKRVAVFLGNNLLRIWADNLPSRSDR